MLEVSALRVEYGTTVAVESLDLTVGDGEAVALLGANGAGKTSTLSAISALVPCKGTVMFDGRNVTGMAAERIARMGLIQVPEGRHVFPTLSVEENLQIGQVAAAGRSGGYSFDDVYSLFPALVPLRKRLGYALSGGEQQMVAVGRALVAAPRLLLLDEPSLGLSPRVARLVFEALAQVRERTPVLVVEQNTKLTLGLCSRGYVLHGGAVVLSGASEKLHDRATLLASYLGQVPAETPDGSSLT